MAEQFDLCPERCAAAGLAHDICREFSDRELKLITGKEHLHPVLLHGEAGAIVLNKDFSIEDDSVLNAVRFHISGGPGLDDVSKAVFAADYMEEGRKHLDHKERERLFSLDLDDMVLDIARSIRSHLEKKRLVVEPQLLHMIEELS